MDGLWVDSGMLGNVNLTILQQNLLSLSSTNKYELVVVENEDLYRYEWLFTIDLLMPLLSVDYSQMKYQLAEAWMFDNSTSMLMQNVVELHNSLLSSFIFISEKKFFAMKLMRHIFLRFIFTKSLSLSLQISSCSFYLSLSLWLSLSHTHTYN